MVRVDRSDARILVVEDDRAIARGIVDNLEIEGYQVRWEADGETGLEAALEWRPDLILLDVMMPKKSGFEVLREIRRLNITVPVIVVTAKAEEFERCLGLDLGADDYVLKPFSLRELLARVSAQLRRVNQFLGAAVRLSFGDVEVDFASHSMTVGGEDVHATSTELSVLRFLSEREGQVLSRDRIMEGVWGYGHFGSPRTVDNFIHSLRQKIEPEQDSPCYLRTVRGAGYCFSRSGRGGE